MKLDYNAHSEMLRCEGSVFLTGGRILLAGEVTFSEHSNSFQLVVLGGTARYAGVRGFVQANDLPSGNMNFAFHLMS